MVSLVWWILSLFKVCSFSWIPVMIECTGLFIIGVIRAFKETSYTSYNNKSHEKDTLVSDIIDLLLFASLGYAIFAFYKLFFGLEISAWWILLSPIVAAIVIVIPGGFTALGLLFEKNGLMTLPKWGLITSITVDAILFILLVLFIVMIIQEHNEKKKEKRRKKR